MIITEEGKIEESMLAKIVQENADALQKACPQIDRLDAEMILTMAISKYSDYILDRVMKIVEKV